MTDVAVIKSIGTEGGPLLRQAVATKMQKHTGEKGVATALGATEKGKQDVPRKAIGKQQRYTAKQRGPHEAREYVAKADDEAAGQADAATKTQHTRHRKKKYKNKRKFTQNGDHKTDMESIQDKATLPESSEDLSHSMPVETSKSDESIDQKPKAENNGEVTDHFDWADLTDDESQDITLCSAAQTMETTDSSKDTLVEKIKAEPKDKSDTKSNGEPLASASNENANTLNRNLNDVTNIFNVKLRSVKSTHSNKKYSERLNKIEPIETIMGLSLDQIYKLDLNDIKVKKIIAQANKTLSNIIEFTLANREQIFQDENKRSCFLQFCLNIALYESRGLAKTRQVYPDIVEQFGHYKELTLEFTQTQFTKSEKTLHQNNFDYTILSYIGNILVWLSAQLDKNEAAKLLNHFGLDNKTIKVCFGGRHLWDQLFKEDTINMKRWKHIIKFREIFPLQANQFAVLLRLMEVQSFAISP